MSTKLTKEKTGADWWKENEEKKAKCLEMAYAGWPKTQMAKELGVNRNTVIAWCQHPDFQKALHERNVDAQVTGRQRRVRETSMLADRIVKLASKELDELEAGQKVGDLRRLRSARELLAEYRDFRNQERIDSGENVQRHQVGVNVSGVVQHTVSQQDFKQFMEEALDSNVIDVEALDTTNAHSLLVSMTEQALLETDVLDKMGEEDLAWQEASKNE